MADPIALVGDGMRTRRTGGRNRRRAAVAAAVVVTFLVGGGGVGAATTLTIDEFAVPTVLGVPFEIAAGADGNMWFTERDAGIVARVGPDGVVTEFPLSDSLSAPVGIAGGLDGNLWVALRDANAIARVTTTGAITVYPLPHADSRPMDIAPGSDGAMWFAERLGGRIGRITDDGAITEYALPDGARPAAITLGPDGRMWFVDQGLDQIGRISATGTVTWFDLGASGLCLRDLVAGSDGAIWFTERNTNRIGRLALNGSVTWFTLPSLDSSPAGIALAHDGNVWFTEQTYSRVGQITPLGEIQEFSLAWSSGPFGVAAGPDGNVWFTAFSGMVGRVNLPRDTTPPSIAIHSPADGTAVVASDVASLGSFMASYECTDEAGGTGLASCDGSVPNGTQLAMTPGVHGLSVTASDNNGNTASLTHSYVVFASWTGDLALPPAWSTVRAGMPVKTSFDLGGYYGRTLFSPGSPSSEQIDCASGASTGADAVANGSLRFSRGRYTWQWKTERAWSGTCRALTMDFPFGGGASIRLLVHFD